jgi:2-polyprenyl-3-methyl-5-hydroxy-6-metoxy-1,4-benzoquinol methylase
MSQIANTQAPVQEMPLYQINWGSFALIEFLASERENIGTKYKNCLDIGSGPGVHTAIMREAGLEVFQLDKYSETAEYKVDFIAHEFNQKFDVIFCSHVIEHQRNVGLFLDKIFDILSDDGVLIISAPKHPAERMVEGHINSFIFPLFLQQLIYAGFDCRNGKFISAFNIENAFLVSKASNFDLSERSEAGYEWTEKHRERSFCNLETSETTNEKPVFYNCKIFSLTGPINLKIDMPKNYRPIGIEISIGQLNFGVKI